MKSVIFAKLGPSTNQKRAYSRYKIDTGGNGNLMSFKILRILFLKPLIATLCTTKNNSVILETNNQSGIEQ